MSVGRAIFPIRTAVRIPSKSVEVENEVDVVGMNTARVNGFDAGVSARSTQN